MEKAKEEIRKPLDYTNLEKKLDELDAVASEIPADGAEDVDVGFAGVAAAGADLAELEGAAEEAMDFLFHVAGEL